MEKIKEKIQNLISYLIWDREWYWLHLLISTLCDLEMQGKLLKDIDFKDEIDFSDIIRTSAGEEYTRASINIPKNTFYCDDCPYADRSKIATALLGHQSAGYCYYLGKGDYSFVKATSILWDGCKECGRYSFEDDEDF